MRASMAMSQPFDGDPIARATRAAVRLPGVTPGTTLEEECSPDGDRLVTVRAPAKLI